MIGGVPARVVLVLVSLLVLGWSSVLLRDHRIGQAAFADSKQRNLSQARFAHDVQRLEDARFLNPDSQWDLYRGSAYLARGRPRTAVAVLEKLVRREPDSFQAWSVLATAARQVDPERAQQASAQVGRLTSPRR
jgi:predicted Zn-dependent protease